MKIQSLKLLNFRNVGAEGAEYFFSGDKVLFWGSNGRGKTNLLEALAILSVGKSWRETCAQDLIHDGADMARIELSLANGDIYAAQIFPRARKFLRNEKPLPIKRLLGQVPSVLFVPEQLQIFSGSKRARMQFWDRFIAQMYPLCREQLSRCEKAVRHKTQILRQEDVLWDDVRPWNEILAQNIPPVFHKRQEVLHAIQSEFQKQFSALAATEEPVGMGLVSPETWTPTEDGVREFFRINFPREKAAARNFLAPSRDDIAFFLRERPLTATASRGEERSVLLALLAAQKNWLIAQDIQPILLLDDVFSELDAWRQGHLERLCEGVQTFFTTTHEEHVAFFTTEVQKVEIVSKDILF